MPLPPNNYLCLECVQKSSVCLWINPVEYERKNDNCLSCWKTINMIPLVHYIKERIETLREKMDKEKSQHEEYTLEYMDIVSRLSELQAVLSKIEELWK